MLITISKYNIYEKKEIYIYIYIEIYANRINWSSNKSGLMKGFNQVSAAGEHI